MLKQIYGILSRVVVKYVAHKLDLRSDPLAFELERVPFVNIAGEVMDVDGKELEQKQPEMKSECALCCDGPNDVLGDVIKCCGNCDGALCHPACWNKAVFEDRSYDVEVPSDDGNDIELENPVRPARICPYCRTSEVVPRHRMPCGAPSNPSPLFGFAGSEQKGGTITMQAGDGEEYRIHPWTVFKLKWPRRLEKTGEIYSYRVATAVGNHSLSFVAPVLYEDDNIVATFGPICLVKPGKKLKQWPINWANADWVRYAGRMAIKYYHGASNFTTEQVRYKMMEIISKDIPLWECAEGDCHNWAESEEARHYAENRMMHYVKLKEKTEGYMFLKRAMSSTMTSSEILTIYKFSAFLPWFKSFEMLLLTCLPGLFLAAYAGEHYVLAGLLSGPLAFLIWKLDSVTGLLAGLAVEMPRLRIANSVSILKSCSFGVTLPEMQEGASLMVNRKCNMMAKCAEKKTIEVYGTIISGIPAVVPIGCCHDLYNGLRIRVLFKRFWDQTENFRFVMFACNFLKNHLWSQWMGFTFTEWWLHLAGARRKVLTDEDNHNPFSIGSWLADIFVKGEAYIGKSFDCFKPRIIQCRKASLQVAIGAYFYSVYKFFARSFSTGKLRYATTMTALELGQWVSVQQGIPVECDASNWDGSVSKYMFQIEKYFLKNIVPVQPHFLDALLQNWDCTTGASKGISYRCDWARRSGDMWTSFMNTLLNIVITLYVWGVCLLSAVFNGDDSIFFVSSVEDLESYLEKYRKLGFKMEIIVRRSWRDLEFCSGRFYQTARGVKWGLKPFRQLCKFGINFKRHSKKKFKGLLLGNALSMLPIAGHIPIFGVFLRRIVETSKGITALDVGRDEWQITDSIVDEIDPREVNRFMEMYRLTERDYQKLLNWANSVHIDNFPMVLDDDIFKRCAQIDLGIVSELRTDHYHGEEWFEMEKRHEGDDWFIAVEELFARYFAWGWLFNGVFEWIFGSFWAPITHCCLNFVRVRYGPLVGLICHYALNKTIRRFRSNAWSILRGHLPGKFRKVDVLGKVWCDSLLTKIVIDANLPTLREPGLFRLIHDCVGSLINRLTWSIKKYQRFHRKLVFPKEQVRKNTRNSKSVKQVVVRVKTTAKGKKAKGKRDSRGGYQLHPSCLAKINPFLPQCAGMRSPDNFGYPTATASMKSAFGLPQTNAAGYSAAIYTPFANTAQYIPLSIDASGVITWAGGSATTMAQAAVLDSIASAYRTVGWGLRITTDLSLTAASGHLYVCHVPLNNRYVTFPRGNAPTNEQQVDSSVMVQKYSLVELSERPLIVAGRAFDDGVYRFRDATNVSESYSQTFVESFSGWCGIMVYVGGAPGATTSNPVNIELINHIEYMQEGNSLYGFIDAIPGAYSPEAMATGAGIESSAPVGMIETAIDSVEGVMRVAGRALTLGARVANVIGAANQWAGQLAGSRNGLIGHANSPFARIGWK